MALADLRDAEAAEVAFAEIRPVWMRACHAAAELAHEGQDKQGLWLSNVEGTRNVAGSCRRHGVKKSDLHLHEPPLGQAA